MTANHPKLRSVQDAGLTIFKIKTVLSKSWQAGHPKSQSHNSKFLVAVTRLSL
jgi:hypothetical protein